MVGSFSSNRDSEAEFFFRTCICVREEKKKKKVVWGYIGTCRLLSVLKKKCVEMTAV
jgi:hypothetical protein